MDSPFPTWRDKNEISPNAPKDEDKERDRAMLYESLRKKYAMDTQAADKEAAHDQTAVSIGSALDQMLGAGARARSGQKFSAAAYDGMSDRIQNRAKVARADARQAMGDAMQQEEVAYEDKVRGRQQEEWNRQDADNDPASEESRRIQSIASKMLPGHDFSNMSAAQIHKSLPMLKEIATKNAPAPAPKPTYKEYTDKGGNTRGGKVVNGEILMSENDPIVKPAAQPKDDPKLKRAEEERTYRYNQLVSNANKLKGLVERFGTMELTGPQSSDMDRLIYEMAVDYAKMVDPESVAREGEVNAAKQYMLPFRDGLSSLFTRNSTAQKQIDNYIAGLDQRLKSQRDASQGLVYEPGQRTEGGGLGISDTAYAGSDKDLESKITMFMKRNNITDRDEAIRILKENRKL